MLVTVQGHSPLCMPRPREDWVRKGARAFSNMKVEHKETQWLKNPSRRFRCCSLEEDTDYDERTLLSRVSKTCVLALCCCV
jgi:hypothetical protein